MVEHARRRGGTRSSGSKKEAWRRMDPERQEAVLENLGFNSEVCNMIRNEEAKDRY